MLFKRAFDLREEMLELWSFSIVQVKCYGCHVMEDLGYISELGSQ